MRRFLLIFMMLLLPLQFTWGMAARYCSHETGDRVSHVGHHAHVHQAAASDAGTAASFDNGDDTDCGYCHLGCAQPLVSTAPTVAVISASVRVPPEFLPDSYQIPDGIDRPNWTHAS